MVVPRENVQPPAAETLREIQRNRHVLPELLPARRVANKPPLASGHVPGVEVEQGNVEPGIPYGLLELPEILPRGPPELDRSKSCLRGAPEPLQQRNFLE